MYVKTYSREYANRLDSMLLDQFKDLANLYVAHKPLSIGQMVGNQLTCHCNMILNTRPAEMEVTN